MNIASDPSTLSFRQRLDAVRNFPEVPRISFSEKLDGILQAAESFERSPEAVGSRNFAGEATLSIPNRGSLTRTADGFILALQRSQPVPTSDSAGSLPQFDTYRYDSNKGVIFCQEAEDPGFKLDLATQTVLSTPDSLRSTPAPTPTPTPWWGLGFVPVRWGGA